MFLEQQISLLEWFLKGHVTLKTGVMITGINYKLTKMTKLLNLSIQSKPFLETYCNFCGKCKVKEAKDDRMDVKKGKETTTCFSMKERKPITIQVCKYHAVLPCKIYESISLMFGRVCHKSMSIHFLLSVMAKPLSYTSSI